MKNFWRFNSFYFLIILVSLIIRIPSAQAYKDSILDNYDKVWEAVLKVLEPHGVEKADQEKGIIESDWIEDIVERTRNVVPFNNQIQLDRKVHRRYRLRIELEEQKDATVQISIRGKFQEREDDMRPQTPWKKVKPTSADFDAERTFFFSVLRQLEHVYR